MYLKFLDDLGSAMAWWANLPNQRKTATDLGAELKCPTSTSKVGRAG